MIFQAMINMAVAVELLPVTGHTISSGGSSIWMSFPIISVTLKRRRNSRGTERCQRKKHKKLIDAELASEEDLDNYSIEDRARNPMNAVLNK
jgi:cell division protein FtsW